jgi:ubiquitin carboxyl-terminal hydrolase 4/11/15
MAELGTTGAFDNPLAFSGQPFVPLRPDVERGTDYEFFSEEAWNKIVDWYGVTDGQVPLTRQAHNAAPEGASSSNILYEAYPPVFTVRRVPSAPSSTQVDAAAVKLVASRHEGIQSFLARAKQAAGISIQLKVKVYKQLDSETVAGDMPNAAQPGILSPPTSRNPSPSPSASSKLVMTTSDFAKWAEGVNFESIGIQDQTATENYNGKSTLDTLGLVTDQTLILEEQQRGLSGTEFASQKKNNSQLSQTSSRRTSPAPTAPVTRGRSRKDGRTRGAIGLINLGNTCYMNSALQCISRVEELAVYFLHQKHKPEINANNPLGYNGKIANAYANFLAGLYNDNSASAFRPNGFKGALSMAQPMFSGYGQQDSQEFLSFLVDALHEDLNRIQKKPYIENPDSDDKTVHDPDAIRQLGDIYRENHRARNDSIAMDLFNGFYKNTMVCPTCDKVSITFDPYSLLTLQLPIENTWQGRIMFMPVVGHPSAHMVDVEKNLSVKALKDVFVEKIGHGLTRERLMFAEIFNHRFYKIAYDTQTLSELEFSSTDILCMYELPESPTNASVMPKRRATYRSVYNDSSNDDLPGMDTPLAETMAIMVFHSASTGRNSSASLALNPTFVTITREEARSYDAIMRRVLASVATMTTKRFLEESSDEDASYSADEEVGPDAKDADVSMRDGSEAPSKQHSDYISARLKGMFEMKYVKPSGDMFITGTDNVGNAYPMQSRVRIVEQRRGSTTSLASNTSHRSNDSGYSGQGRSSSDDDQDVDPLVNSYEATAGHNAFSGDVQSDEESGMNSLEELSAKDTRRRKFYTKKASKTYGRRGGRQNKRQTKHSNTTRATAAEDATDDNPYYIKLGEGILLEWQDDAFESLFSGRDGDGTFTFNEKTVPEVDDPELRVKQHKRTQRKKNGISLDDCFTETGKTETLSEDNAWYCSRCKELRRADKTLELWTVPDILVLHLKRFSGERYRRDKVDVLVDFPVEGLDLTKRVGCKEEGKEYIYDLFAVDNHYGGLGGGHYTAYAKNFYDGNWYDYNDSSVSRRSAEGVVSTAAYLLFYRRRSATPLGPAYLQELVLQARNPDEASEDEDDDDNSGEGQRLGDHSSASSRLPGSSSDGAAGATAATAETPLQGVVDKAARSSTTATTGRRARKLQMDSLEDVDFPDERFGTHGSNNNITAVALANQQATWGFGGLGDDDTNDNEEEEDDDDENVGSVNTPAESDRPDVGSDAGDRDMDFDDDDDDDDDDYTNININNNEEMQDALDHQSPVLSTMEHYEGDTIVGGRDSSMPDNE